MAEIQQPLSGHGFTKLSDPDFQRISRYIGTTFGIYLPPGKKELVQSRLRKRLRILNIPTFREYVDFLFAEKGTEERTYQIIDVISTNKTGFFREPLHFDFLLKDLLPAYLLQRGGQPVKLLSAGCASGEEVYSLAMALMDIRQPPLPFVVYGADVSATILDAAAKGVYPYARSADIPVHLLRKYVMKSRDQAKPLIRISPGIRQKTVFIHMNLMDDDYPIPGDLDVVFCRNTLIYFEKSNQEAIVRKLSRHLRSGGYLFVGHSESLIHMDIQMKQIKPTIYQKL